MRMYLLFPLAYLSGVHGFLIFVPYLLVIVAAGHVFQKRRPATVKVVVERDMQPYSMQRQEA